MAKTYKNIGGTWYPIKKIYKNISGTWNVIKKLYKKVSGTWQVVYSGAVDYTFTSSITATASTGILLSNYVDPASADEFNIIVNSGVVLSGYTGGTGGNGAYNAGVTLASNCHGSSLGYGGNGGTGGAGSYGINFTGFSGKTINLINYGTIKGGNGGTGGRGGNGYSNRWGNTMSYGGCGGTGGAGGAWNYGNSGVTFTYTGNSPYNGSNGAIGASGTNGRWGVITSSCFSPNSKVLMADGTYKNIEEIQIGEKVQGAYDFVNEVMSLNRPLVGNRDMTLVNDLLSTADHPMVNGDVNGFVAVNVEDVMAEIGESQTVNHRGETITHYYHGISDKVTNLKPIEVGKSTVLTLNGPELVERSTTVKMPYDTQLYSLTVSGSHTFCVNGYFVGGGANEYDFDYTTGRVIEGRITDSAREYEEYKKEMQCK